MMSDTTTAHSPAVPIAPKRINWFMPHRVIMMLIAAGLVILAATTMRWDWIPQYQNQLLVGIGRTLALLFSSVIVGLLLAIPLGLAQVTGPKPLGWLAASFCGIIRGTPLLLQLWLLYYGLGSILAANPDFRKEYPEIFYYIRQAWPYGFLALMLSFAAYEGEVMRGAFKGVPRGELEAAKSYGMGPWTMFRRIWLPRALHRALPTLTGDTVLQLKSTPLVATITVVDAYGVISKVRQATYLTYEPLLLLALIYMILTGIMVVAFRYFENMVPSKR
ncbi:ABC transporter permease subunit [Rhizobium sp. LjRoot254]|uniref:ABC transporter permease subunit n=1 Tax=Rhizobium sp. LjRoot254 TaxID=3342297 RepID=UPI003ECF1B17